MIYDDFAQKLARDYELYLFALSGRYLSYVSPGIGASPLIVLQFEQGATKLRQTFLETANVAIDTYARQQPSARSKDLSFDLKAQLAQATMQNIATLSKRMRGTALSEASLMRGFHGAMGMLLQRKLSQPEFDVRTSSGRIYKAVPLIRSQAREFAYRSFLSAELARFAAYTDLMSVTYLDPAKQSRVFSITGRTPGFPSFDDIESEVFHYNATAGVTHHVPA